MNINKKNKLSEIFSKKFVLLVSIPLNDPEMARAAGEGGADGIKVHLNVTHYASGTNFKTWSEEKENIRKILEAVSIPVGLLPGAETTATLDEIIEARDMGISFLDSFAHHMPVYLWNLEGLEKMLAVNQSYSSQNVKALEEMGMDFLEATVLPHEEYGKRLTMRDLALYKWLADSTSVPIVIPTQKKIYPEEIQAIKKAGASGIVIGAVVTGKTPEGVYRTTRLFSDAINCL